MQKRSKGISKGPSEGPFTYLFEAARTFSKMEIKGLFFSIQENHSETNDDQHNSPDLQMASRLLIAISLESARIDSSLSGAGKLFAHFFGGRSQAEQSIALIHLSLP
jgi:hypothetical protein